MNKKTFKVPVIWSMYGHLTIEAENVDEAIDLAEEYSLPKNGHYVEGSFEIDHEVIEEIK